MIWESGDLAMCISTPVGDVKGVWCPVTGHIYRVMEAGVIHTFEGDRVGLNFYEDTDYREDCAFDAVHFIKWDGGEEIERKVCAYV